MLTAVFVCGAAVCFVLFQQILTYTEAVKTVDHDKALGKPNSLWIAFAKFYEKHGDVDNARVIFNKAVQVRFRQLRSVVAATHGCIFTNTGAVHVCG